MEPLDALNQIAFRLERNGADTYKVRAFRGAARAIKDVPDDDLEALAKAGRLQSIEGVGKSTAQVIAEALDGKVPAYLTKIDQELTKDDLDGRGRRGRAPRVPPGRLPLPLRLVRRRQPHPRDGRGRPRPRVATTSS